MSELEALCENLSAINGDILRMAEELHAKAMAYSRAAAHAAQASRSAEGQGAASLGRAAGALDAAARHSGLAAQLLQAASVEGQAFVQRTATGDVAAMAGSRSPVSGELGGRGVSTDTLVTVLEDGSSPRASDQAESIGVSSVLDAFIAAHDPTTLRFDPGAFMGRINPRFEGYVGSVGERPHNINCGLCAQAVGLALDGRPHLAAGANHGVSVVEMSRWAGCSQSEQSPDSIAERLRSMAPGSHAIVGVDYSSGGGHWFNAYWDGETVWALDGQVGSCDKWPPSFPAIERWDAIFTEGGRLEWRS